MQIALASDHAGFDYKQKIAEHLRDLGHAVLDLGTHSSQPCNYPDYIHPAAQAVVTGQCERGIVLGGSGNGEAMAANRHKGIRCALCWTVETAVLSRQHNNANMISIGQRMVTPEIALAIVDAWLTTDFEGGRHLTRIQGIDAFDLPSNT